MDIGDGAHTPESAMSLAEELAMLRKRVKDQDKEIRRSKKRKMNFSRKQVLFFDSQPSEVSKEPKNDVHCHKNGRRRD